MKVYTNYETVSKNEHKSDKFIWIPRIVAIVYVLFLMIFSLNAFKIEGGTGVKIAGFIYYSLPSITVTAVLASYWRSPRACGIIFLAIGAFFTFRLGTYHSMDTFLLTSLPPLLAGILFLVAFARQKK